LFVKTLFILFNWQLSKELTFQEVTGIYISGMKLDISASTYILIFPFLLTFAGIFLHSKIFRFLINWYTYILIVIVSFIVIVDMELYKYWGFRLDTSPLIYINTPKEMLASVEWFIIVKQLIILILLLVNVIFFFGFFLNPIFKKINTGSWIEALVYLPLFVSLIIPLRGGVGLAPLNTGTAYFSNNEFANHSAINVLWNVGYSITESEKLKNPYIVFTNDEAKKEMSSLIKTNSNASINLLKVKRPNILIIMIESFTAKLIPALGGLDSVTPCFNKLVHEGILFKNFYSSGVRSDKGIVAVISGFPAQPMNSIMKFPDKTQSLPFITKDVQNFGYRSAYYYGGNIDFVSMRSYLTNAKFNKIISMSDFPASEYNAKWGVHDHIMFNRLKQDIDTAANPFLYVFFTLSSHEPFDVPMKTVIPGNDGDHKFMNSMYYTDSCLGDFICKAKKTSWWNNTLIVITADHGALMIHNTPAYEPIRFLIPMLWTGGAIAVKDTSIKTIGSQTDIALTLLDQLNIKPQQNYYYSRDILDNSNKGFAYFAFNNGFGLITDTCKVTFDYTQQKVKVSTGVGDKALLRKGKAFLQLLYDDFMMRK
jgi:phosphoglycerol transferase MdoB-like AlkP superfamily enzyme